MSQGVAERTEGVDGVAQPGVLHHHDRRQPAEPRAGGNCHAVAFVSRRHVRRVAIRNHFVDE